MLNWTVQFPDMQQISSQIKYLLILCGALSFAGVVGAQSVARQTQWQPTRGEEVKIQGFTIEPGERIAQLIVAPYAEVRFTHANELAVSQRSTGGFGSTGAPGSTLWMCSMVSRSVWPVTKTTGISHSSRSRLATSMPSRPRSLRSRLCVTMGGVDDDDIDMGVR